MLTPLTPNARWRVGRPTTAQLRSLHPGTHLVWHDFADLWLKPPLGRVLDYGCGDGSFLERISDRCVSQVGVDIDPEQVGLAAQRRGIRALLIQPGEPLPFEDQSFDTVILKEVIEHVSDERTVLGEAARVLVPVGRLLLTTPHRGLLTFLDPGNVKFLMPRLHRFLHLSVLRQKQYYETRFGDQRRTKLGMIADFTADRAAWHRHYSYRQIRALAPPELTPIDRAVYYPAFRALWFFTLSLKVISFGRIGAVPAPLRWIDDRLSRVETRLGDQLVVLFVKQA